MKELKEKLLKIDHKSYGAYKDIKGSYIGNFFTLHIDHVQADPFAPPSRIRVEVNLNNIKIESQWLSQKYRKIAIEDFFARECNEYIVNINKAKKGPTKSSLFIDGPGQEIMERSAVKIYNNKLEFRLSLGLPAAGRKILGQVAIKLIFNDLINVIRETTKNFSYEKLKQQVYLSDQQNYIRNFLQENNYVSFIANGSILPRKSGTSNLPLKEDIVVPFKSPKSLEVEVSIPHHRPIKGMAIPKGITLIVGGGYHGKTTLLKAIERGVYNHISGDGREYVITDKSAFKIRAEDGRIIEKVNISPFITHLPFNKDTTSFSSKDASGSTSQAANIIEALEIKSELLLVDEDTSATNFMIRDARMQALINKEKEPITPFIDKISSLYEEHDISTILVIGGSGDYLEVAHRVIMMEDYLPSDVSDMAKEVLSNLKTNRRSEGGNTFGSFSSRTILPDSFRVDLNKKIKIKGNGIDSILFNKEKINLLNIEQLIDASQTNALAYIFQFISKQMTKDPKEYTLEELINSIYSILESKGLDSISPFIGQHPGDLAMPRKQELAAAINRFPRLKIK